MEEKENFFSRQKLRGQTLKAGNLIITMSINQLSRGSVNEACTSSSIKEGTVLQVVQISQKKPGAQRRIALSDGSFVVTGVVYDPAEEMFNNDEVKTNSIISLKKCTFSKVNEKIAVNINDIEVIQLDVPNQLGTPVKWTPGAQSQPASTKPPAPKAARSAPPPPRKVQRIQFDPISQLSSYTNNFTILARVVSKDFKNIESKGLKILTVTLADQSGEIKGTFWRDAAVKFDEIIEKDKVYTFSGGKIKFANKTYNTTTHDCEINFDNSTKVEAASDDVNTEEIGKPKFNFKTIADVDGMNKDAVVDLMTVAIDVPMPTTKHLKTGRDVEHISIEVADLSNRKIELNVWGENCKSFQENTHPIIVLKDAKVGEFGGKKNLTLGSVFIIDPQDMPEADKVREWFEELNGNFDNIKGFASSSYENAPRRTPLVLLKTLADENVGGNGHPQYVDVVASIFNFVPGRSFFYNACPNEGCKGKGLKERDGGLFCDSCGQMINNPVPRFNYRIELADFTGVLPFVQVFGEESGIDKLTGCDARTFKAEWDEIEDEDKITPMTRKLNERSKGMEFRFRLKAAENTYNEKSTIKFNVVSVFDVNYREVSKKKIDEIAKYE